MVQAELEPANTSLTDVTDAFWGDAHRSLGTEEASREAYSTRDHPSDLIVIRVGKNGDATPMHGANLGALAAAALTETTLPDSLCGMRRTSCRTRGGFGGVARGMARGNAPTAFLRQEPSTAQMRHH